MQRRKFLIGTGALAAGSAAAIGSGAFTAMQAGRDADINVVSDSEGLIALTDETPSDIIRESSNGELLIDFTADGSAGGVNVDSRYQVGEFVAINKNFTPGVPPLLEGTSSNVMSDPAFNIVNNDTVNHEVGVSYECDASDIGGARLIWQFEDEARQYFIDLTGTSTSGSVLVDGKGADPAPEPGDAVHAALFVDTRGYTGDADDLDLSGTLTVSAE